MPRLLIFSPSPEAPSSSTRWQDVLAGHTARLEAAGFTVDTAPWSDPVAPGAYDLITPLVAWSYHKAPDLWTATLDHLQAEQPARIVNPAPVLRWNADKRYLPELAALGAPVTPSIVVSKLTPQDVLHALKDFGGDRVVAKPTISGGAKLTKVLRAGDDLDGAPTGPALLQPFLPAIASEGEWSLIFFAGAFSHAVLKTPKAGDFRSQPDFAAFVRAETPPDDVMRAAHSVLDVINAPLTYARIDLVRGLTGAPVLMEAELIEPDLYLSYAADGGAAFGAAFKAALNI